MTRHIYADNSCPAYDSTDFVVYLDLNPWPRFPNRCCCGGRGDSIAAVRLTALERRMQGPLLADIVSSQPIPYAVVRGKSFVFPKTAFGEHGGPRLSAHNLSFVPRRQKRVDGGGANASGECSHSPARDSARHPLVPHRLWSAPLHLGAVLPADRKLLIHPTHG